MKYISLTSSTSAQFTILGYELDTTTAVYLSTASTTIHLPALTTINFYSYVPSATSRGFFSFSGSPLSTYSVISGSVMNVTVTGLTGVGLLDVIFSSVAGYSLLSNKGYLINMTG